jgi:hypothetical protein
MAKKLLSCLLMLGLAFSILMVSPSDADAKGKKRSKSSARSSKRSKGKRQVRRSGKRRYTVARNRRGKRGYSRISGPASAMPQERVLEIQTALKREGFLTVEPSGSYDKATVDAMSAYQKSKKIRATGYPTAEALNNLGLTKNRRVVSPAPNENRESGPQTPVTPEAQEPAESN